MASCLQDSVGTPVLDRGISKALHLTLLDPHDILSIFALFQLLSHVHVSRLHSTEVCIADLTHALAKSHIRSKWISELIPVYTVKPVSYKQYAEFCQLP